MRPLLFYLPSLIPLISIKSPFQMRQSTLSRSHYDRSAHPNRRPAGVNPPPITPAPQMSAPTTLPASRSPIAAVRQPVRRCPLDGVSCLNLPLFSLRQQPRRAKLSHNTLFVTDSLAHVSQPV